MITEVILPNINIHNCLLFLNEAIKKIKACGDTTNDLWYVMLNRTIDEVSKNLIKL